MTMTRRPAGAHSVPPPVRRRSELAVTATGRQRTNAPARRESTEPLHKHWRGGLSWSGRSRDVLNMIFG